MYSTNNMFTVLLYNGLCIAAICLYCCKLLSFSHMSYKFCASCYILEYKNIFEHKSIFYMHLHSVTLKDIGKKNKYLLYQSI